MSNVQATALLLGLGAFALRVVVEFGIEPTSWRLSFAPAFIVYAAGAATALAVPLLAFARLCPRPRPAPRTLLVSHDRARPAFVAATSPWMVGPFVIMLMFLAGNGLATERAPDGDVSIHAAGWAQTALTVAVIFSIAAWTLFRGPRVELRPGGLLIRNVRTHMVRWDSVLASGPPAPVEKPRQISLLVRRQPPEYGAYVVRILHRWLAVDAGFLANSIRHYVDHPEHRAEIGSRQELDRLCATMEI
ncbi:hypothetical protein [Phytohabitans rumicis]|uniref:hypothetical protein n=1 Tax=Phytohabitans rumicis TaxID=1076125 RepID=UPI00156343CF|nr:hypothetical protein [Phytohabitans rumicis]